MGNWGATRDPRLAADGAVLLPSPGLLFDREFSVCALTLELLSRAAVAKRAAKTQAAKRRETQGEAGSVLSFKKVNNDIGLWLTI